MLHWCAIQPLSRWLLWILQKFVLFCFVLTWNWEIYGWLQERTPVVTARWLVKVCPSETLWVGSWRRCPRNWDKGYVNLFFRSALGKRLLCRKWYHRLFFFFFPKVFVIAKSMAPAHLGVLENYLFPYNALSNPFLAILALSLRKKRYVFFCI